MIRRPSSELQSLPMWGVEGARAVLRKRKCPVLLTCPVVVLLFPATCLVPMLFGPLPLGECSS